MPDEAELAYDAEQLALSLALANVGDKYKHIPALSATGKCHYCEAKIKKPKLFCDSDCEKDWRKYILKESIR